MDGWEPPRYQVRSLTVSEQTGGSEGSSPAVLLYAMSIRSSRSRWVSERAAKTRANNLLLGNSALIIFILKVYQKFVYKSTKQGRESKPGKRPFASSSISTKPPSTLVGVGKLVADRGPRWVSPVLTYSVGLFNSDVKAIGQP